MDVMVNGCEELSDDEQERAAQMVILAQREIIRELRDKVKELGGDE